MRHQCPHYHGTNVCEVSKDTDGQVPPDGVKGMVDHFCLVQNQTETLAVLLYVCPCLSGPKLRHQRPDYRGPNVNNYSQDTDGEVQSDVAQGMVDHVCLVHNRPRLLFVLFHAGPAD